MDDMEWARFAIDYIVKARSATHEEFNEVMREVREHRNARGTSWYGKCKGITHNLYHSSVDFTGDRKIPGDTFSSPNDFATKLAKYRDYVGAMANDLDQEIETYNRNSKVHPFLVGAVKGQVDYILGALDYVERMRGSMSEPSGPLIDLALAENLAARFHESVLTLITHPHGGTVLSINDEWDCQYLFRSILAGYFRDVRPEEGNPSVAGSSSRCEFFLKQARIMIELKYVRKASDQKKIKTELLTDFADYGANSEVDYLIALIYDPGQRLPAAVQIQGDLSGPSKGLKDIRVIVSPPR